MLKLIACWDLKEHPIIIIIIKNHKGKISIEFSESANSEKNRTLELELCKVFHFLTVFTIGFDQQLERFLCEREEYFHST